jgi:hypothetical protein
MATAKEIWSRRNGVKVNTNINKNKPLEQINKKTLTEIATKLEIVIPDGATNKEIVALIKAKQGE